MQPDTETLLRASIREVEAKKKKPAVVTEIQLSELKPLDLLNQTFSELIGAVEQMIESQAGEDGLAAAEKVGEALTAPARVDDVVALMSYYETRESMLRTAVKVAEDRARNQKKFVQNLKDSIELYMREKGIAKIEGFAHYLAIYKKPNQLVIENEDLIPDEFFDREMVEQKTLNKERLLAQLEKEEVPGATLLKDQKRLGVK